VGAVFAADFFTVEVVTLRGLVRYPKVLILDRDPVFSKSVRGTLEAAGVEVARLPAKSPNLNAYAERFIGSVRRECLSKVIPLGETHLRRTLESFVAHYHHERNHQGLGNRLIEPTIAASGYRRIQRHTRLGGMLSFYSREMA